MSSYERSKIGTLFSWGGEHIVYEYGTDKLLKYSIFYYLIGRNAFGKATKDYEICKRYLGDYILDTEIAVSANGKHVVHIQPKVSGRALMRADMKSPKIREQFVDLMNHYDSMVRNENVPIDLIGREGVFNGGLTNIFVTDSEDLRIIDATGLECSATGWLTPAFFLLKIVVLFLQDINIRGFRRMLA